MDSPDRLAAAKRELRAAVLSARRAADPGRRASDDAALARHLLAAPRVAVLGPGDTVAGYRPLPGEPSPGPVLDALAARGVGVLLPLLLADGDLDWVDADGTRRGRGAITGCAVVLVPGLAGDRGGGRLGRGGGSYDRALARLDAAAPGWTCLLLHPVEVVDRVPALPHDRRVAAVATADGVLATGRDVPPTGDGGSGADRRD